MTPSVERLDRALAKRGLPWRMYAHGMSYRIHWPDGRKTNLGRDLGEALRRYYALTAAPPFDPAAKELSSAYMVARHRKGARQRSLEFTLTVDDVDALMEEQGRCCAITGAAFTPAKVAGVRIRPYLPSLDRIDNDRGYVPGNFRVVCAFVNVAMKAFGDALFAEVFKGVIAARVQAELKRIELLHERGSIPTVGSGGIAAGTLSVQANSEASLSA